MELIKDTEFGGERPLFESHDLRLENGLSAPANRPSKSVAISKL